MRNNPKNISFEDIKRFLESYGYACENSGGSHFVFRKEFSPTIVIPYNKPIKAVYVKHVLEILGV
ncbi:MAG: type II toxin-antitoxin system HicA family toxin [Campylobacteraceae bacterium]|nr:type II toxin-antitoxin system HicA family toxin [Campylobacteraceae bacterium]